MFSLAPSSSEECTECAHTGHVRSMDAALEGLHQEGAEWRKLLLLFMRRAGILASADDTGVIDEE